MGIRGAGFVDVRLGQLRTSSTVAESFVHIALTHPRAVIWLTIRYLMWSTL